MFPEIIIQAVVVGTVVKGKQISIVLTLSTQFRYLLS